MPTKQPEPHVPDAVVEWLEALYPDRASREEQSLFEMGRRAGQQDVIDRLRKAAHTPW